MYLHLFSIRGKTPQTTDELARIFEDEKIEPRVIQMLLDAIRVGIEVLGELRTATTALQEIRSQPDYGISCPQNFEAMGLVARFPGLLDILIRGLIKPDLCEETFQGIHETLEEALTKMKN